MQKRYAKNIINDGCFRSSSAAFCIPEEYEQEKLIDTLSCAIYHAIGISIINNSIDNRAMLKDVAKDTEGIGLMIMNAVDKTLEGIDASVYSINGKTSYPYVKVKQIEDKLLKEKQFVLLPIEYMDRYVHGENEVSPRFFQKVSGKQQFLHNCDMGAIVEICRNGAEYFAKYFEREQLKV